MERAFHCLRSHVTYGTNFAPWIGEEHVFKESVLKNGFSSEMIHTIGPLGLRPSENYNILIVSKNESNTLKVKRA